MNPTKIGGHEYFHKVVDCQWACPAHTPVPEYIRLIAAGRYSDAYMINWRSNVFPGILGRVCDRPCEPACRRGRVDSEPVAICRLKRVAADLKDDIHDRLPQPAKSNGKRIACVGAGPASLTVARDLSVLGYQVTVFDNGTAPGGNFICAFDLGHRTTHICAVAPHPSRSGQVLVSFARTIARGGEHLTRALGRALGVDFARAEELKHMHGISGDGEPLVTRALREALRPLLRDLRQTLAAYVARYGEPPRIAYLTGGTAQLAGLGPLISEELGLEARELLPPPGAPWLHGAQRDHGPDQDQ